jgi:hypothetical protein
MARTITAVQRSEGSLPVRGIFTTYRACPARAHQGQSNRSIAHPAEYFLGEASAIGTYPGKRSAFCCRATGHQSLYSSFALGQKTGLHSKSRRLILQIPSGFCAINVSRRLFSTPIFPFTRFLTPLIWSPLSALAIGGHEARGFTCASRHVGVILSLLPLYHASPLYLSSPLPPSLPLTAVLPKSS